MGNTLNVLVHIKLAPGFELKCLGQLDEIRKNLAKGFEVLEMKTLIDVVFVEDMSLAV